MKTLVFSGKVECLDKESLICCKEIVLNNHHNNFKEYPLSLLEMEITQEGIIIDGIHYKWDLFPVVIRKQAKHVTKYREVIEETITIHIEEKLY